MGKLLTAGQFARCSALSETPDLLFHFFFVLFLFLSGHAAYGHALQLGGPKDKHLVQGKHNQAMNTKLNNIRWNSPFLSFVLSIKQLMEAKQI